MAVGLIVIATSCQRDGGIIGRDWLPGATGFSSAARCTLGRMTPNTIAVRIASLLVLERTDRAAAEVGAEQLRCDVVAAIADGAPDTAFLSQLAVSTVVESIGQTSSETTCGQPVLTLQDKLYRVRRYF